MGKSVLYRVPRRSLRRSSRHAGSGKKKSAVPLKEVVHMGCLHNFNVPNGSVGKTPIRMPKVLGSILIMALFFLV